MKLAKLAAAALDTISARRVFAEPYERDGTVVLPAATVFGGGGGGRGDERGKDVEGGGFGVTIRPVGAYVVTGGRVRWRPAFDVNRFVTTVGAVAITYLCTRGRRARP